MGRRRTLARRAAIHRTAWPGQQVHTRWRRARSTAAKYRVWRRTLADCSASRERRQRVARAACGRARARDLPLGLCWSARCADSVRGCPCHPAAGSPRARTYSGQRRHREHRPVTFVQVRWHMEVQAGEVCKTVGSAYVGSNPTPATHFRRSKPVTLNCVTGFSRERERFSRPSAVSRGLCVGRLRQSAGIASDAA